MQPACNPALVLVCPCWTTGGIQAGPAVPQSGAVRRGTHEHELHHALLQPQEENRRVYCFGERRRRRWRPGKNLVLKMVCITVVLIQQLRRFPGAPMAGLPQAPNVFFSLREFP